MILRIMKICRYLDILYIVFSVLIMDESIKTTKVSKIKMVKVEIQLNEEVKIGLIGYKTSDHIKKIYTDMKKIKIIGDKVEPQDVKYFDKEGVALD